jgi:DNA-binding SARP family transcriptional activator
MPRLTVHLLGPPRIERDGVAIKVDTRKAIALLAYLAAAAEPQSRESLAALLWPEAEQSRARAALRRTLSALNKAVPDGALEIGRGSVALDSSIETWVDLAAFRSHLAERPLAG